jgi:hypothetical protein
MLYSQARLCVYAPREEPSVWSHWRPWLAVRLSLVYGRWSTGERCPRAHGSVGGSGVETFAAVIRSMWQTRSSLRVWPQRARICGRELELGKVRRRIDTPLRGVSLQEERGKSWRRQLNVRAKQEHHWLVRFDAYGCTGRSCVPQGGDESLLVSGGFGEAALSPHERDAEVSGADSGKPLLRIWLELLASHGVKDVLVNTHHFAEKVHEFAATWTAPPGLHITTEEALLAVPERFAKIGTLCAARRTSWSAMPTI